MLRKHGNKKIGMEFVGIEELVSKDHLLRKIDRVVDFNSPRQRGLIPSCFCRRAPMNSGQTVFVSAE